MTLFNCAEVAHGPARVPSWRVPCAPGNAPSCCVEGCPPAPGCAVSAAQAHVLADFPSPRPIRHTPKNVAASPAFTCQPPPAAPGHQVRACQQPSPLVSDHCSELRQPPFPGGCGPGLPGAFSVTDLYLRISAGSSWAGRSGLVLCEIRSDCLSGPEEAILLLADFLLAPLGLRFFPQFN